MRKKKLCIQGIILCICVLLFGSGLFVKKAYSPSWQLGGLLGGSLTLWSEAQNAFDALEEDNDYSVVDAILNGSSIAQGGSSVDFLLDVASGYSNYLSQVIGKELVKSVINCFNPSFDLLFLVSEGEIADFDGLGDGNTVTKEEVYHSHNIYTLIRNTRIIGIALASIITILGLLFCMVGTDKQISSTPLEIISFYIVSIIAIYLSFDITWEITTIASNLWKQTVLSSGGVTIHYGHFSDVLKVNDSTATLNILGMQFSAVDFLVGIFGPIFSIILIWKLIKGWLGLFFEIAERWAVSIFLLLFFPVVIPTIITKNTRMITKSYGRMIFSQFLVLFFNGMLMKFFITVLIAGGWTAGIVNYVLALAFLKVCRKLDSYMSSMGLNIAQTGGGLLDSMRRAGGGFGRMLQSLSHGSRLLQNLGNGLMTAGVSTNNFGTYAKGYKMAHLVESIANPNVGTSALNSFAKEFGGTSDSAIPSTLSDTLRDAGVNMEKIGGYEAVGQGQWAIKDNNGKVFARTNGNTVTRSSFATAHRMATQKMERNVGTVDYKKQQRTNAQKSMGIMTHTGNPQMAMVTRQDVLKNIPHANRIINDSRGVDSKLMKSCAEGKNMCFVEQKIPNATTGGYDYKTVAVSIYDEVQHPEATKFRDAVHITSGRDDTTPIAMTWETYSVEDVPTSADYADRSNPSSSASIFESAVESLPLPQNAHVIDMDASYEAAAQATRDEYYEV